MRSPVNNVDEENPRAVSWLAFIMTSLPVIAKPYLARRLTCFRPNRTRLTCFTDHWSKSHLTAYENLDVKTYSHPNAFPSSLRQKRALVQGHKDDGSRQKDEDPVVSPIHLAFLSLRGIWKADPFCSKRDGLRTDRCKRSVKSVVISD